jgi:endoglucanase
MRKATRGFWLCSILSACVNERPPSEEDSNNDSPGVSGGQSGVVGGTGPTGGFPLGGGNGAGGGTGLTGSGAGNGAGGSASGGAPDASSGGSFLPSVGGGTSLYGEKYPFPQEVTYPHGLRSTKINSDRVRTWYSQWAPKYLMECNGNLLPGTDPLSTALVEAQGFAMIAAAYMGDKPTFDQLNGYYEAKLTSQGCNLMGWKNNCSGFEDQGSATDGDIDVASGLIVAHWQWPDAGYDDKARSVIGALKNMILDCSGTSALHPGCSNGTRWGGCNETDISYYSPAFFRYFAEISNDPAWTKLADDSHVLRDRAAHPTTGLVPDWQSTSGTAGAGSRKGYFSFDAIRTPFKHGLDFLWNGNPEAEVWCQKISSWAHDQGVQSLKDEYQLDGTGPGQNHNLAVVGSLTICAMANTQTILDDFVTESVRLRPDFWYSTYLGNLYLLAMSGNMWNPELVSH